VITLATVGGLLVIWIAYAARPTPAAFRTSDSVIDVRTGPDGNTPVSLDTTLYLPRQASATHKVPAVLLAHGFGGTKQSVAAQAEELAGHGYAVLAWTAEGFGRSTGQIHLDSVDWEYATPAACGVLTGESARLGGQAIRVANRRRLYTAYVSLLSHAANFEITGDAIVPRSPGRPGQRVPAQLLAPARSMACSEGLGRPVLHLRCQRQIWRPSRRRRRRDPHAARAIAASGRRRPMR
jgi:hypothetical protein